MPKRTDDFMARRPRTITQRDGSVTLDPRDWGPGAIDRAGNAIMCNITGSHGPRLRNGIASTLPTFIKPTGGANAPGPHRRRRKGGRPGCGGSKNRTLQANARQAEIDDHLSLLCRYVHRQLDAHEWQHFLHLSHSLRHAIKLDVVTQAEKREIGRAKAAGRDYSTFYTGAGPAPVAPRPKVERWQAPKCKSEPSKAMSDFMLAFLPKGK